MIKSSLFRRISILAIFGALLMSYQNCGQGFSAASLASSSNSSSGQSLDNANPPTPPTGLIAVPNTSAAGEVDLSWQDYDASIANFLVERANSVAGGPFSSTPNVAGTYTQLASVAGTSETYKDTTVQPSTPYFYRVTAVRGSISAVGDPVTVTSASAPLSTPAAPSSVQVQATAATVLTISWMDNSNNESGFEVDRSAGNANNFILVGAPSANQNSFEDVNLNPQTIYFYRVRAVNTVGDSAYSANASGTTLAAGNTSTFSYVSANILNTNCVSCHSTANPASGISYSTYASTLLTVQPGNPSGSSLYNSVNGGNMPLGGKLTATQIQQLQGWINAGAPNN